jgi:hypothetical protein
MKKEDIKDLAESMTEPAVNIVANLLLEGLVSQMIPGITTTLLSYRQKRSEKMVEKFINELKSRQVEIEKMLSNLEIGKLNEFSTKYFPIILDHILDTKQEEKIELITNGFVNTIAVQFCDENIIDNYLNVLKDINLLDIRVLNEFKSEFTIKDNTDSNRMVSRTNSLLFSELIDRTNLEKSELAFIVSKLEKHCLIENTQFFEYEKVVDRVQKISNNQYDNKVDKDDITMPPYYILTNYGINFIKYFYKRNI